MDEKTILYHYCSTAAFDQITRSEKLRLSSIKSSNDTLEGQLTSQSIERLARKGSMDDRRLRFLVDCVKAFERSADGLAFCLAKDGDLLSQWRGYADNGSGVSIGFRISSLQRISEIFLDKRKSENSFDPSFTIKQVKYRESEHDELLESNYKALEERLTDEVLGSSLPSLLNSDDLSDVNGRKNAAAYKFALAFPLLLEHLFVLKPFAFHEENEYRLVSLLVDNVLDQCEYYERSGRIVPCRYYPMNPSEKPIERVILGPKHSTDPEIVKRLLRHRGYGDVEVQRSEASSYR